MCLGNINTRSRLLLKYRSSQTVPREGSSTWLVIHTGVGYGQAVNYVPERYLTNYLPLSISACRNPRCSGGPPAPGIALALDRCRGHRRVSRAARPPVRNVARLAAGASLGVASCSLRFFAAGATFNGASTGRILVQSWVCPPQQRLAEGATPKSTVPTERLPAICDL